jgi:hypothetical protein
MSELMEKILADKAAERKRLVALPYEEKLALLEKMRDRSLLIKKSKQAVEFDTRKQSRN